VKWLEKYLISKTNVTCLIVSHDSGYVLAFASAHRADPRAQISRQCNIRHHALRGQEGAPDAYLPVIALSCAQLAFYRGNLSTFVEAHPEAKSYYTLAATSIKFTFPPPGSLMGVRSNTRAILKMTNCTYTYPGRSTPNLLNVSCALSLSRWALCGGRAQAGADAPQPSRRHRAERRGEEHADQTAYRRDGAAGRHGVPSSRTPYRLRRPARDAPHRCGLPCMLTALRARR
jgi:ATPase subunit of ABC transporter with duplicated ATPase domains